MVGLGHSEDAAVAEAESGQEVGEKVKGQWRQEGDLLATAPSRRHPSGPSRGGGSHLSTLPGPQRPVTAPIGPLRPPGPWPASPRPGPPLRPFTEPGMVPTRRWLMEAPAPPADLGLFRGIHVTEGESRVSRLKHVLDAQCPNDGLKCKMCRIFKDKTRDFKGISSCEQLPYLTSSVSSGQGHCPLRCP